MRVVIDTDKLALFLEPTTRYDLLKKYGSTKYSSFFKLVNKYVSYGFARDESPNRRNPNIKVELYQIIELGRHLLSRARE